MEGAAIKVTTMKDAAHAYLDQLEAAGRVLGDRVPAVPGDNPDELPNRPRWVQ